MPHKAKIPSLPAEGFIRLPHVLALFQVEKSKIWAMVKAGTFPTPKKFGHKTSLWDVREIREFMDSLSKKGSI